MNLSNIKLGAIALFSTISIGVFGQSERVAPNNKSELLREVVKEKIRAGAQGVDNGFVGALGSQKQMSSGYDQRLTTQSFSAIEEGETFIAVNPNDSMNLVASFMSLGGLVGLRFPIYYSNDGGSTWDLSNFKTDSVVKSYNPGALIAGGGDPVFAYANDGTLYFSWIYLHLTQSQDSIYFDLLWAYSSDKGKTWNCELGNDKFIGRGDLNPMTGGMGTFADGIFDRQWMEVDNTGGTYDGNLYTSCVFFPNNSTTLAGDGIVVRVKPAGATSFNTANSVVTNNPSQFANVQVASNGDVHVVYADLLTESIMHSKSTNGGQTFSTPTLVSVGSNLFGGDNFQHGRENAATNMVIDQNDNLHVVWTNFTTTGFNSVYARSTNGGLTWLTTPLDNIFPNKSFMPSVSAFNGKVAIAAHNIDNNDSSTFYMALSNDGGATFYMTQQVSSGAHRFTDFSTQTWFGDYDKSSRTNCTVYSTFSDGRSGNPRTYVAKLNECSNVGIPEISTINGFLKVGNVYPNPVVDKGQLTISSTEDCQLTLSLFDLNGKEIKSIGEVEITKGENVISLEHNGVSSGIYFWNGSTTKGDRFTRKVIVQ